jgi:hypothetical protein
MDTHNLVKKIALSVARIAASAVIYTVVSKQVSKIIDRIDDKLRNN